MRENELFCNYSSGAVLWNHFCLRINLIQAAYMAVFKSRRAVLILSPHFQRRAWFLFIHYYLSLSILLLPSLMFLFLSPSFSAVVLTMIFNLQPVRARHEKYFVILSLRLHFFIFCNLSLSDSAIHLSCSSLSLRKTIASPQ